MIFLSTLMMLLSCSAFSWLLYMLITGTSSGRAWWVGGIGGMCILLVIMVTIQIIKEKL